MEQNIVVKPEAPSLGREQRRRLFEFVAMHISTKKKVTLGLRNYYRSHFEDTH
jgi:hypothetical protein